MDTRTNRSSPPSMIKLVLWLILCLIMRFWAVVGPFFVVLAAISFFVDISSVAGMTLFHGKPVRTAEQKALFLAVGAVMGVMGNGFLWLRRRGYLKDPI